MGPPGTGKTTFLQKKVEELIRFYKPEEFCLTSFTKSAALVLKERIEGIENVGTLHSLCFKNLGRVSIAETSKNIKLWNEENPSMKMSHSSKIDIDNPLEDHNLSHECDVLFSDIQIARARMIPVDSLSRKHVEFFAAWTRFKDKNALWDFTDLIEANLDNNSCPPNEPNVLIVDEAQDLTRLEMALVKKWSKSVDVFLIAGDSDQCLYSFKGSDPVDFSCMNEDIHILEQSYRVPLHAWSFANNVIKRCKEREQVSYFPAKKEGNLNFLNVNYNDLKLLKHIEKDIKDGKSVMCLVSCGYMLDTLIKNLKAQGIPFHNPYRFKQGAWNPIRQGSRGQVTTSESLQAFMSDNADNLENFLKWQKLLKRGVFKYGINQEIERLKKDKRLFEYVWNTFVPMDVKHSLKNTQWYLDNCLSTKKKSLEYPLKLLKSGNLTNEPNIIVGTIHSVKGGEADVVYLFPDLSAAAMCNIDDSIHRMFYVAATRCKQTLNLCSAVSQKKYNWR